MTDTQLSGSYAVISGHANVDWAAFAAVPTLVVLMAGQQVAHIATQLLATGWRGSTPVSSRDGHVHAACVCWLQEHVLAGRPPFALKHCM